MSDKANLAVLLKKVAKARRIAKELYKAINEIQADAIAHFWPAGFSMMAQVALDLMTPIQTLLIRIEQLVEAKRNEL